MTDPYSPSRSRRASSALSVRSLNLRQPTWKGSALSKNAAPVAAVSNVFAEPEQVSPSKTASGSLLSTSPSTSTGVAEGEGARISLPDAPRRGTKFSKSAVNSPTKGSTQSLKLGQKASMPNLAPRQTHRSPSLFASLSRSKGKTTARQLTSDNQQPLPPVVQVVDTLRLEEDVGESTSTTSEHLTSITPTPVIQPPPPPQVQEHETNDEHLPIAKTAQIVIPVSAPKSAPTSQRLPVQSLGSRSWSSSTSSSPPSSPPAPNYSPPHPPLVLTNELYRPSFSNSPFSFSPPPMVATSSTHSVSTVTSLPSSIDDRVPSLPTTPPVYSPSNLPSNSPLLPSATSMNASSSRFSLGFPILGRSKVPSDTIISQTTRRNPDIITITSAGAQMPSIEGSTPLESFVESPIGGTLLPATTTQSSATNDAETPQTATPQDPIVANLSQLPPSEAENHSEDTPTVKLPTKQLAERSQLPAKWWDYAGWGASSSTTNLHLNDESKGTDGVEEAERESTDVLDKAKDGVEDRTTAASPAEAGTAQAPSTAVETDPIPLETTQPPTYVNTDDASDTVQPIEEASNPSWLAPWAWYTHATASAHMSSIDGTTQETLTEEVTTVSGQVPNDSVAEASEAATPDQPAIDNSTVEQKLEETTTSTPNPISDSFEANKLGWMSFFSSKMLTMKRVGYEPGRLIEDVRRDENGMEVMDIDDDDEDQLERGRELERKAVGNGASIPLPISGLPATSSATASRDASNASLRRQLAPPLTISQDLKKETEKVNRRMTSNAPTPLNGNSRVHTPAPSSPTPSVPATPTNDRTGTVVTTATTTTTSKNGKIKTSTSTSKRIASPTPSKKSAAPLPPNLVLPTWQDTFLAPPRNVLPPQPQSYSDDQGVGGRLLGKTMKFVSGVLWSQDGRFTESTSSVKGKEKTGQGSAVDTESSMAKERAERFGDFGKELPKAWSVYEDAGWDTKDLLNGRPHRLTQLPSTVGKDALRGCRRAVVIGVHGWFPGTMIRTVLGEPTGTSTKFTTMMEQALIEFENEHDVKFEKITQIPLEGEGTIEKRVEQHYRNLLANEYWMSELHEADAILIATHSQGSVVSTHLLNRLIQDHHIVTSRTQPSPQGTGAETFPSSIGVVPRRKTQRVCCLALCGIHLGPLRYLSSSTLVGPYIQYFESTAARELFEFQNTESEVSKAYASALENVLDHGIKMVYVASLNDQVVPLYSGLFTAISHPLILRALYIDGDAYHSSDFLSNLLVLLLRILNTGIPESGLLAHLSEATAGSLSGVGHSTAYEELATFSLAVKYLFLSDSGIPEAAKMSIEPFNANHEQNDYEIPWALRDIIADERVAHFFASEIAELRDAFRHWHPKTSILRDLKRKLQPITRLPSSFSSTSKL